jgi:cobalt/nickel transport system permease protein
VIASLPSIDLLAGSGRTPWHRASALTKLLLVLGIVGLAVFTPSLRLLAALAALALALAVSARVPAKLVATALAYPSMIALVFVVASWDGAWGPAARLLLRPTTSSLAALWLVATTPYPDLFAPISRLLPRAIGDGLFITYRALFELIGRAERMWRSLRIRGGGRVPARQRLGAAGDGLATLVLYAFERSQRLYATMHLRGHSGRICGCRHYAELTRADLLVGATALAVAAMGVTLGGAS